MRFFLRHYPRVLIASSLIALYAFPQNLVAQAHVVSPAEIQQQVLRASQARQRNQETVREFLSSSKARKALKAAHIEAERVQTAVSTLSDEELAQLASRADNARHDFAAGTLSDRDLILIILGIAVLVLVIVAVR
jgi:hypothetical protein